MDSSNSGSMFSSGGDEEYDSRAESISAFLNPPSHVGSLSNHPPHQPPPSHQHHHQQTHASWEAREMNDWTKSMPKKPRR
jgi:hypothetical protein